MWKVRTKERIRTRIGMQAGRQAGRQADRETDKEAKSTKYAHTKYISPSKNRHELLLLRHHNIRNNTQSQITRK